jgi:hypothetical protein
MRKSLRICISAFLALSFVLAFVLPSAAQGRAASSGSEGTHGLGMVLSKPDPSRSFASKGYGLQSAPLAASIDITASAPPIGDQGQQSSCVGWSAGYYCKSWWEKKEHPSWDLNDQRYQFSPAFVYNQINGGADGGSSFDEAFTLLEQTGCTDLDQFPYNDSDYTSQPNSQDVEAAKQYRIPGDWGYFFASDSLGGYFNNDLTELKSWLSQGKPAVLGIPLFRDFPDYRGNPTSSFYNHTGSTVLDGGHGVFIGGYSDSVGGGQGGFLMLNSWGAGWNGNGRVYLSYDFVRHYAPEAWFMSDQDSSPSISSISPASAGPGQIVTINGNNLGAARRSARVGFTGGGSGEYVAWTNAQVKVRVPSSAQSGTLYAYDWNTERSNGKFFTAGEGSNAGADWLLAEGATWPGYDEWVLLQNPNNEGSTAAVTFLTPDGAVTGPTVGVPGLSRVTVHVNDYVPNADVSTAVAVTSGPSICAERAMYFSTTDGKWGSHDSIAASGVSDKWYLAEGATLPGYDEWILVMNPFNTAVNASVTFQTPGGTVQGPRLSLAANTRQSVHVNDYVPNQDVSATVQCTTSGYGVVVERSMYMNTPDGKIDCHNSMGATETSSAWALAEGATWPGYEEWVLVQNPTSADAAVRIYFLTAGGVIDGPRGNVAPGTRVSVRVNDYAPDCDVSTMVFTESEDEAVVAERAMYIASPDGKRGATNAPGSGYAAQQWLLPEGCTSPGFDEWVLVANPYTDVTATVQLTFMTPAGQVQGPSASVPPASRVTFHVNDYVTGDVSTRITSQGYVVAERAMYIKTPQGKNGATCSLGVHVPTQGASSAPGEKGGSMAPGEKPLRAFEFDR